MSFLSPVIAMVGVKQIAVEKEKWNDEEMECFLAVLL
jgi:hypothetical protein